MSKKTFKSVKKVIGITLASAVFSCLLFNHSRTLPINYILPTEPQTVQIEKRILEDMDYKPGMIQFEEDKLGEIDYNQLTSWQEAIKYIQTPEQAQIFLNKFFHYNYSEQAIVPLRILGIPLKKGTFKNNYADKKGICFDYAVVAAALLSDNGYPPLILSQWSLDYGDSSFLYKNSNGLYGAIGTHPEEPIYKTIKELAQQINYEIEENIHSYRWFNNWKEGFIQTPIPPYDSDERINPTAPTVSVYNIVNLNDIFKNKEWIWGDIDLESRINFLTNLNLIR